MQITYQTLCQTILAQGIVNAQAVQADADFRQDLNYHPTDLDELIRLMQKELGITIPQEDCRELATISQLASYLKNRVDNSR